MNKQCKIKKITWEEMPDWRDNNESEFRFSSIFGSITVRRSWRYEDNQDIPDGYSWDYCFDEFYDEASHCCESYEDGKQKAEVFYLSRLMPALEEIK